VSAQSIARKYASALYDIAEKNHSSDGVARDIASLIATLDANVELDRVLSSPLIVARKKRALIDALLVAAPETSVEVSRLLRLLADRDRLGSIRDVASQYRALAMHAGRAIGAEVVTAVPVDAARTARLAEALGKATGQHVSVTGRVDPSIVAGVVAKIGGVVYDGSAARQMELMKQKLVADA
jgi:F-type H+-transporting ATPase subunit delta